MKGERMRGTTIAFIAIFAVSLTQVKCAKLSARPPLTKPVLLNSYLPAAMQVLAHLTNQMKFERPPPTTTTSTTTESPSTFPPPKDDVSPTTSHQDLTTHSHAPGNFAPITPPPRPKTSNLQPPNFSGMLPPLPFNDRSYDTPNTQFLPEILPYDGNLPIVYQQNIPLYTRNSFPIQNPNIPLPVYSSNTYFPVESPLEFYEPNPFHIPGIQNPQGADWYNSARSDSVVVNSAAYEGVPDISALPVANENNFKYNPLELDSDELNDENLQYLAPTVREMLQGLHQTKQLNAQGHPLASYQSIEDLFDNTSDKQDISDWLRLKKAAPNQTLIQMLLMYDLLSRDAKKQKLNNYNGYTSELLKDLVETSQGTSIDQLRTVMERMVARGDCTHDFANNRAKEMIAELGKPDSKMSKELRYLDPLKYLE